ncbi:MAG: stage III sporulation protein AE [bacterium]|nr:stage III sporulation protein AE [bacterium]
MKRFLVILGIVLFFSCQSVHAEDNTENIQDAWLKEFLQETDVSKIDELLEEIFPNDNISFQEILDLLLNEEKTIPVEKITDYISGLLFDTIRKNRMAIVFLFVLSLISAFFSNFVNVFQNKQISSIGFYVVYLLMISVCLQAFHLTITGIETSIGQLVTFMKFFSPIYFISMAISVGSVSSIAFYNIVILLIYIVELVIFRLLLPFVHIYLTMQILNFLSEEDVLSKCSELIQMAVDWSIKFLLAAITGISLVEGLLSPAIDTVKRNALTKGVEMIPGLGDVVGGTGEMLLGVAVLVKNGIGVAGAIIIISICMVPVLNMAVVTLMYKLLAAIVQPLAEKRFTETIASMGEGYLLLLKIEIAAAALFLITIAVAVKAAG